MFKCNFCDSIFDEPELEEVNMEDYYGVSSMFSNSHYEMIGLCPYCNSEDFDSYWEDEDEDI